ncbi:hypothetical protein VB779_18565 [Haloarculaceae archaeon H-GB11]|nr:hypothetical protein [Haloarculaceae archaeon H-GB11]
MPLDQFEIDTYELTIDPRDRSTTRTIRIDSTPFFSGIRNRAFLNFYRPGDVPTQLGWAFNVGGLNRNGITVVASMDVESYDDIYTTIQSESPVFFRYGYASSGFPPTTRQLTEFAVTTEPEPPGEGPGEESAELAIRAFIAHGQLDPDEVQPSMAGCDDREELEVLADADSEAEYEELLP